MRKRLIDVFPNYVSSGIFAKLDALFDVPWETQSTILDTDYIAGESGGKNISPLVERLLTESGVLDNAGITALASIIWNRFGDSWIRIWEVLTAEYAPLENYNMKETTMEAEGTERKPDLVNENEIIAETRNTDKSVYGFNSTSPVPSDAEVDSLNGKRKSTEKGAEQTSRLNNKSLVRSGNIGVTTSQQMAESELALRKHHFFELVYEDCDEILTLPIYCKEVHFYEN